MLTKELAIFDFEGDRIKPDRLTRRQHGHYLDYAQAMLEVYRQGIGKMRQELHAGIRRVFAGEPDCPPQRVDAFSRLLDEDGISEYDTDRHGKAASLRRQVFSLAGPNHPLVERRDILFEHSEAETKAAIAERLGRENWAEVEAGLFADVVEYHRLKSFTGYPRAEALLSRYNVAQVQVTLFRAKRLVIRAKTDLQPIVTYAKLARLLHDIQAPPDNQAGGEYIIVLDGPVSILRETRRYGVNMAKFLPGLLSCRGWRMEGEICLGKFPRRYRLELSSESGLGSDLSPHPQFDSSVEEAFARKWGVEKRNGWSMKRAGAILQKKQTTFVPDFVFQHDDGRKIFLEIVGFWTPEYLQAKIEKLKLFEEERILLAVVESVAAKWQDRPRNVILYKTALKLNDVLEALEREGGCERIGVQS
jgi:predicted nuclease of restriction endonuclease-like RecB superfamily